MRNRAYFTRAAVALLMTANLSGTPGRAQDLLLSADPMARARAAAASNDPAEALSRYLRVLSTRPKDLEALTGAGRAALDIGDPRAAIGFFARAEEIAPRNGRVKAGLGSAMLQMENARAALRLFEHAVDLGVSPGEVASDRGLAYDLRGDNRRAQQEYALALTTRDDAETSRRLALSLAISGDRPGALAVLDPLLRRQDIPAWRARAFVLALTGDVAGAETAALSVMPRPQAAALQPFLARLPALKAVQQAAAVHFGRFPSDVRRHSEGKMSADTSVAPAPPPVSVGSGLIPAGEPLGRGAGTNDSVVAREPIATAPRRRPGTEDRLASVMASVRASPTPSDESILAAMPAPKPATPPVKPDAKVKKSTKEAKARPAERYWVQVAGGANKADLPKVFAKLKAKSPKLFAGRSAWTTSLRATNRLLVGPFKTLGEAQDFVNLASKDALSAFTYTSPAGQEVDRLVAK